MHHSRAVAAVIFFPVVFEVVSVSRHYDRNLIVPQETMDAAECFVSALVAAARIKRMAEDHHREPAPRSRQRLFKPLSLSGIDAAQDTGVNSN